MKVKVWEITDGSSKWYLLYDKRDDYQNCIYNNGFEEGRNEIMKKFTHLEELESRGLIAATREDEKAIQEYINNLAIDESLTIDDYLRVFYNDIYIADLKQI